MDGNSSSGRRRGENSQRDTEAALPHRVVPFCV